jgi:DNA-binding NarL/FixJ family response regulator
MPEQESRMIELASNGFVAAIKGNRRLSSAIVSGLPESPKSYDGNRMARKQIGQLTSRELEVLQFVAEGKLNKQAASELCISIKTVEKHRERLTKKLGIHGIAGLTHFAIFAGIVPCNPQLAEA